MLVQCMKFASVGVSAIKTILCCNLKHNEQPLTIQARESDRKEKCSKKEEKNNSRDSNVVSTVVLTWANSASFAEQDVSGAVTTWSSRSPVWKKRKASREKQGKREENNKGGQTRLWAQYRQKYCKCRISSSLRHVPIPSYDVYIQNRHSCVTSRPATDFWSLWFDVLLTATSFLVDVVQSCWPHHLIII